MDKNIKTGGNMIYDENITLGEFSKLKLKDGIKRVIDHKELFILEVE